MALYCTERERNRVLFDIYRPHSPGTTVCIDYSKAILDVVHLVPYRQEVLPLPNDQVYKYFGRYTLDDVLVPVQRL